MENRDQRSALNALASTTSLVQLQLNNAHSTIVERAKREQTMSMAQSNQTLRSQSKSERFFKFRASRISTISRL
jgi:hypothetical protein